MKFRSTWFAINNVQIDSVKRRRESGKEFSERTDDHKKKINEVQSFIDYFNQYSHTY